jgi:hypothetical protein
MEVLQEGYQSSRKKIYTLPTQVPPPHQRSASPSHEASFLPRMTDDPSPQSDRLLNGVNSKGPAYLSAAEVAAQIDRYRTVIKDKDVELSKLKHELLLLKQVIHDDLFYLWDIIIENKIYMETFNVKKIQLERRQQKELEAFELRLEEAPRVIKGLQDEILRLKV